MTKLQTVIDLITSKNLYLMILAIIAFLTLIFITTNGSNKKESKRAYILLYLAVAIFIIVQYGNSARSLLDYAINEVFITYYFPNIVIYLLMLLTTNIILWKTLFKENSDRKLKVINSIAYGLIIYLFILALSIINNLKLNVFNIVELYSSNQVRSLLELSMLIFVFWIIILFTYHLIKKYQYKHKIIKEKTFTNYNIINDLNLPKAYRSSVKPLENSKPKNEETQNLEGRFTLEEYKIMAKMLKEEEQLTSTPKENNDSKNTESNSFDNTDVTSSLTALNRLYQSIED